MGADPIGPISTKIGRVKGAHDVIIQSNFGFNIFRGFRSTGGRNLHCPIDFAGHRYNSAAATAQPVMDNMISDTASISGFPLIHGYLTLNDLERRYYACKSRTSCVELSKA